MKLSTDSFPLVPQLQDLQAVLAEFTGGLPEDAVRGLIALAPTRHTVELASGTRLFTYCALDTLLIPRLLGEDARLWSTPPSGGAALSYGISGGRLQACASWVLSFPQVCFGGHAGRVGNHASGGAFKGHFCPYANAFAGAEAYRAWAARELVATQPLSFAQADALAQQYAAHLRANAPQVCGCGCGI